MRFDNDITVTPERLRALGVRETLQAGRNLDLLASRLGNEAFARLLPLLLQLLSASADPGMAVNNLERFVSGLNDVRSFLSLWGEKPHLPASLITIFGASRFFSTFLSSDSEKAVALLADPEFLGASAGKHRPVERLAAISGTVSDDQEFFRILRIFRKQEMLRIGLRDLLGKADLRETMEDLSDLAEVCLQKAYEWAEARLRARFGRPVVENPDGSFAVAGFAVIAMGKLGGRELNFSSDVDVMYVYTADGETEGVRNAEGGITGRISNHQYFIKLAENLSAAIGEKTEDGFVFRVDLRLRPEGQRGPLAQSLSGYEIYYESWGQTWERSALIKARPVAGDESLGREFIERITPFVYRKYLDYGAIAEIRDMKQKINADVEQKGRTHRDVKLGYGGIREIEFVIQALQLIYAGRDRSLREKNALKALHLLSQKGLITYQEQAGLAKAYVFLRTVEHRIQVLDDLQTHVIPTDETELTALARRALYRERGRESDLLLRDYAEHTRTVRGIYDDLFAFTGEETAAGASRDYDFLLDGERPEQDAVAFFSRQGFRDPAKAYRNLVLLREGAAFVHQTPRSRRLFRNIFPNLFGEIASSADPDMALHHLESFLATQGSWETFQSLLRLDPSAVNVIVAIFANSEYFSRMLISRPEFLQNLLESRKAYGAGTYRVFARELSDALARASGITEKLDVLRRFKHREEMRLGMADLLSNMSSTAVSRDLSKLAEVCLDAALSLAASEVGLRYKLSGPFPGLAIIGVGKLGGRELTYASDLDVLFVYSDPGVHPPQDGISAFEYFSKVSEKTISYLSTLTREGYAFRIDTRLRPTGSKGPLVQSIDAFRSYYSEHAQTWERQALARARAVAGNPAVGREFCSVIRELIYREEGVYTLAKDIRAMRNRIEEEVGKEDSSSYNIKQGAGGLVDIEFIVQYLQLLHGKRQERIRVPGTLNALRAMGKAGLLTQEEYDLFSRSYLFLRRLESRLRIASDRATDELSKRQEEVQRLARRMGYTDYNGTAGQQLLDEYRQVSQRVRNLFEKILSTNKD